MNILKFNFKATVFSIKGKDYKIKPAYIDLILSFIVDRIIYTEKLVNGYVEIPAFAFKKLYDNYWIYIAYLIKSGVIERKPYSVSNHICYSYRFCYQFIRNLQITEVELNNPSETNTDYKEIPLEDQALIDYRIIQRLKSDFQSVEIDTSNIDRVRIDNSAYVDTKKYFYNVVQLFKWKSGGAHHFFNWKSNRLYTNFTFLSSHYRLSNVRLNNEPTVEFDISSSFAIMLAVYCIKVRPEIVNDYDFREYCTSIKQKSFYSDLTKILNQTKDCDAKKVRTDGNGNEITHRVFTKEVVKKLFQIFINGDSCRTPFIEGYSNSFIREQFALKYPCVFEIIEEVKSNNEQLYYKLSKIESEFIFEIVRDLYTQYPQTKILTCHDAISIPFSYKKVSEMIWNTHMDSLLNNLPDNIEKCNFDCTVLNGVEIYEEEDYYNPTERNLNHCIDFDFEDDIEEEDWF